MEFACVCTAVIVTPLRIFVSKSPQDILVIKYNIIKTLNTHVRVRIWTQKVAKSL